MVKAQTAPFCSIDRLRSNLPAAAGEKKKEDILSNTVNVVDSIMGSGKTTAMIRYINESSPDRRFIFCTPYLEQVERIINNCPGRSFVQPDDQFTSKLSSVKALLSANLNIATTHALFMILDDEARELIFDGNYTLIIDEAMDIFGLVDITPYDVWSMCQDYCEEAADHRLSWVSPDYRGRFDIYRQEIEAGAVYRCGPNNLIRITNIETFAAFEQVFLLTYLFDGQLHKTYFEMHGWSFQNWYIEGHDVDTFRLTLDPVPPAARDYTQLINIKHHFRSEKLKTGRACFSLNWYQRCLSKDPTLADQLQILKRHMSSFFRTAASEGYDGAMWTTYKSFRKTLAAPTYNRGFVHCSAKATNAFRDKTALAYPINRYINPNLVNFISARGGKIDHNAFALSEMVQWVWRSAIRDGKPITLYIPSDRMYRLFTNWLDTVSGKTSSASDPDTDQPKPRKKRARKPGDLPEAIPLS